MLNRSIAPEISEIKPFQITKAISKKLSNNIPIHYINSGNLPLIKVEIIFNAGTYFEPKPGTAFFTSKMLNEGTGKYTEKQLAENIAKFGAYVEIETGNDKVSVVLTTLTKYLSYLLNLVDEMIHDSVFKQKNFDSIKNIHLQQLKVSMEKTGFVATGAFRKSIFGKNHPYGYFMTEEMVNTIELNDCISYYNHFFKENAFEIIVSGLINDSIIAEIDNVLGKNKYKIPQGNPIKKEVKTEPDHHVKIEKKDAVQSTIRIGKKLFTRNHPDYLKLTVLNEALGGYFGSRLMKNVREEKGLTYGIYSQVVTLLNEGYFVIGTDVKKELVTTALAEIYKEIEVLKKHPIPDEELSTVKNYMIGSFMGSITTPFSLANKFKGIYFNGLTYDFYDDYVSNIQKISSKDLQLLANKYFDVNAFSEIVVG